MHRSLGEVELVGWDDWTAEFVVSLTAGRAGGARVVLKGA
jgi:hypothetical protein